MSDPNKDTQGAQEATEQASEHQPGEAEASGQEAGAAQQEVENLPHDLDTLRSKALEMAGKVEELEASVTSYQEQALRAKAEGENARRRAEKDAENTRKYALEGFLKEFLPVKDSLEMALRVEVEEGAESAQKLHKGVEMTLNMLNELMQKYGVTEIDPYEEKFDPNFHQAMTTVETGGEPNRVTAVMQKGYLLNERLVRPAMVEVSVSPSATGASAGDESEGGA
ncbi:nucleotide exchange factor GrpE [Thiohalorhabdus sp.]|uniref:nucleotide exchange factor GrpE n=1 Tax=Thiohalorhabdus sp. TaxID=3094134 RepID=UPI002FC2D4B4